MSIPTLGVRLCLMCLMLFGLAAGLGCEKAEESVRKSLRDAENANAFMTALKEAEGRFLATTH